MIDPDVAISSEPSLEPAPLPQPESHVRRFFRDIESAGNLEDGMEFHAAGVVLDTISDRDESSPQITVLYLNPFTAKVEKRSRDLSNVMIYEFPKDDGVYWRLWEQTCTKLEALMSKQ